MESMSGSLMRRLVDGGQAKALAVITVFKGQYLYESVDPKTNTVRSKLVDPSAMRRAFAKEPIDSGWLSPNTIRYGIDLNGEWLVQFIPPAQHKLLLAGEEDKPDETITVSLPGFVFLGVKRNYYVWATDADVFHPNGLAYHAPLPNVGELGKICFGNNRVQAASHSSIDKTWDLFITSPFNNHLIQNKSDAQEEDIRKFLKAVARKKLKQYPVKDLTRCSYYTLEGLIKKIVSEK